jgi:hypothetical protein
MSLDQHIIPPALRDAPQRPLRDRLDEILDRLAQAAIARALEPPAAAGTYSLGQLLETGGFSRKLKERFLARYVGHQGSAEAFWQALRGDPEFANSADGLAFTLQLGALTHNHMPLVSRFQKARQTGRLTALRELARLSTDEWLAFIQGSGNVLGDGFPPDTPGANAQEQARAYAAQLAERVEASFPTASVAYKLERDTTLDLPYRQEISRLLIDDPSFDFASTNIDAYLFRKDSVALAGAASRRAEMALQLKRMQRLFNLSPIVHHYEVIRAMLAAGHTSAHQIVGMGEATFISGHAEPFGGVAVAREVYGRAASVAALTTTLMTAYGPGFNRVPTRVTAAIPAQIEGVPDLQALFGSLDFCDCEHCRSVYSPAAYLVDILAFLERPSTRVLDADGAGPPRTALDLLLERRPEIAKIELSCENTNTLLPYVDIVNEVLESGVAHSDTAYQTAGDVGDLRAQPEHINAAAYVTLARAIYPWSLPFDLAAEEARVYLNHLGVPRHQMLELCSTEAEPLTDLAIAREYLGLTKLEQRLIINGELNEWFGAALPTPAAFWGMSEDSWPGRLRQVPALLRAAGLQIKELEELLATRYIDSDNTLSLTYSPTCALDRATIAFPADDLALALVLDRMHRFLRLQRKIGWTITALDKTITALAAPELDESFLVSVSHLRRLQADLKVPLVEMLSWWSNIDTSSSDDKPSFYERLFLDRSIASPADSIFVLNADGADLADTSGSMSDQGAAISAALGISAGHLDLLVQYELAGAAALNLASLSALYRAVSLARALKLSISDFLSLRVLSGINPFDARDTAATLRFIEKARRVLTSGFQIAELDYILGNIERAPGGNAPTSESIALILNDMCNKLKKIAMETMPIADIAGDQTKGKLALLLEPEYVEQAMAIIGNIAERSPEDQIEQRTFIAGEHSHFGDFLDIAQAQDRLIGPSADFIDNAEARFEYVLEALLIHLRRVLSEAAVTQTLSDALRLDTAVTVLLLNTLVRAQLDGDAPAMIDFLAVLDGDTRGATVSYRLLHRIALLLQRLKLNLKELTYLHEHREHAAWFDLNALARAPIDSAAARFEQWERLHDLTIVRDAYPGGDVNLTDVLGATSLTEASRRLAVLTGWSEAAIDAMAGPDGFHLDALDLPGLIRLRSCFAIFNRLGASVEQLFRWANAGIGAVEALEIKNTAKARYDHAQWGAIASPLRDVFREKQRAALVAYLVGSREAFSDPNDLYAHYLIDVEMSACASTSRIKQAISSVQLFVQRCLMNLEQSPRVEISPYDARQWQQWMKSYRVWEANRKIFLYPENWIDPALRDDKSSFFSDLENALLQNDVTAETVEVAYISYLEKLDEVALLEVCGIYHQLERDEDGLVAVDILHVFGRTHNSPQLYYYRQWVDQSYWKPWERVVLDIQGDHLIPVVWNRRLYLFWAIFTEKVDENQPIPASGEPGSPPEKHWEIQLAWGEHKNGRWSAKRTSHASMNMSRVFRTAEKFSPENTFLFDVRERNGDGNLTIAGRMMRPGDGGATLLALFQIWNGKGNVEVTYQSAADEEGGTYTFEKLFLPPNSHIENMAFVEDSGEHPLTLISGRVDSSRNLIADTQHLMTALRETPGRFRIIYPQQFRQFVTQAPFFYADTTRTFFIVPHMPPVARPAARSGSPLSPFEGLLEPTSSGSYSKRFLFEVFYHPYAGEFIRQLNRYGIDGLLSPRTDGEVPRLRRQQLGDSDVFTAHSPNPFVVDAPYPADEIDFSYSGAYSLYNWELFFHAPLLIADRLSANQRFAEAQRWLHYIFDPTDVSPDVPAPARFWKVRPFFEAEQVDELGRPRSIRFLLQLLHYDDGDPQLRKLKREFEHQISQWRANPFKPHLIARLRTAAYQRAVIMKYLDNLIAWGDQLFQQDTIEAINEATQLYILAAEILGPRPERLPSQPVASKSYEQLKSPGLDTFSNALDSIENALTPTIDELAPASSIDDGATILTTLYFCVPPNDKLLAYWDTVADRLFKIRHCMNIAGVMRRLPLFEPPIDPALLVRAAAAGVDIGSVLSDLGAPLPSHRFQVMLQKTVELCADVRGLGAALLAALEKQDGEELALLRSQHELRLLAEVRQIKEQQIKEAEETLNGLRRSREATEIRHRYYKNIPNMNSSEKLQLDLMTGAMIVQSFGQLLEMAGSTTHTTPDYEAGVSGMGAHATTTTGGSHAGAGLAAFGRSIQIQASMINVSAMQSSIVGSYSRRADDWKLQERLAEKELDQIDKQIAAAEIRLRIAEKDLENHDRQTENAREVDSYMRDKFTNRELYSWMVSQTSALYFQSYQMAYNLAKRTERAFQHELGVPGSSFVQFGYWDSLKKGLLAGEKLHYDLRRMELAYLEQNRRDYELTKHISLVLHDPLALIALKTTGRCFVTLGEALFDADYPGHYLRRIKSVSLTIPCVTGPYTSVNCTLRLHSSKVHRSSERGARGDEPQPGYTSVSAIATSGAQSDSGMFELNFRDERYLPFEGAGAISEWQIEMPPDTNAFDFNTITDVVLRLSYTARDGGEVARTTARKALGLNDSLVRSDDGPPSTARVFQRMFSMRHEFANEWFGFLRSNPPELHFDLLPERFPIQTRGRKISFTKAYVFTNSPLREALTLTLPGNIAIDSTEERPTPPIDGGSISSDQVRHFFALPTGTSLPVTTSDTNWALTAPGGDSKSTDDIILVFVYTVGDP